MNESNNAGLIAIAVTLFMGLTLIAFGIRNGFTRSAAIESGMTADDYAEWMRDVR